MLSLRRLGVCKTAKVLVVRTQIRWCYAGTVTSVIFNQPKWIDRSSHVTRSWQVFEVAVINDIPQSEYEHFNCRGYAPITLSVGDNINFDGNINESEITLQHCSIDNDKPKDIELFQLWHHSKGFPFKLLLALRKQLKHRIFSHIESSDPSLIKIKGIGKARMQNLQKGLQKAIKNNKITINENTKEEQKLNVLQPIIIDGKVTKIIMNKQNRFYLVEVATDTHGKLKTSFYLNSSQIHKGVKITMIGQLSTKNAKQFEADSVSVDVHRENWFQTPNESDMNEMTYALSEEEKTKLLDDWINGDPSAVDRWFEYGIQSSLTMYKCNQYYAPSRSILVQLENTQNIALLEQSKLFETQLSKLHATRKEKYGRNIEKCVSVCDWIENADNWVDRLNNKCKTNKDLKRMINVMIHEPGLIGCVDTEYFAGAVKPQKDLPIDVGIAKLYNIGFATPNGKNISLLIKHPTLSIHDRIKLFSNPHGKSRMLQFVKPIMQYHIDIEGVEKVNVDKLSDAKLEFYFNRYALTPRQAWDIISAHIEKCPFLFYHFANFDRDLILLLAQFCNKEHEIKEHEWFNTRYICDAMFPIPVVSRSLGYLSKQLCHDIDIDWIEHIGSHDALALMRLLQTITNKLKETGIGVSDENDLYNMLSCVGLSEYYDVFCDQGLDDISMFRDIKEQDLIELTMHEKNDRLRLLQEVRNWNYEQENSQ